MNAHSVLQDCFAIRLVLPHRQGLARNLTSVLKVRILPRHNKASVLLDRTVLKVLPCLHVVLQELSMDIPTQAVLLPAHRVVPSISAPVKEAQNPKDFVQQVISVQEGHGQVLLSMM